MIRQKWCKACGNRYRGKGRTAIVVGPSGSGKARVCSACASRAILLVQSAADWRERIEAEQDAENRESRRRARERRKEEKHTAHICRDCGHDRQEHVSTEGTEGYCKVCVDFNGLSSRPLCAGFEDMTAVPQ